MCVVLLEGAFTTATAPQEIHSGFSGKTNSFFACRAWEEEGEGEEGNGWIGSGAVFHEPFAGDD